VQPAADNSTTAASTAWSAAAERFGNVIYQPLSCLRDRAKPIKAGSTFIVNFALTA
jgi:hypothetical protein